ncbi:MAG: 5'/3'-nucleotidase SurE [Acidimicrobiales bacterium]|nr:5'/3'-nucleotidase SurE [Acidimicrobiales bacterium]MDG1876584.1 5'/3'-nucleotidase SurE [Acidimicrobiales bacterium]
MRILVTNDDGIDSIGLHVLARAMRPFGDVVIAAPNTEYSGYGAALGTLHNMKPDVRVEHVEGIDEAWSISAPPALCAMFGRLNVFGDIDLVVSGINPGANVGRAVYHSGTVGACLTARNGGISGVAVSQSVDAFGVEGQGWEEALVTQKWDGAAEVAAIAVGALVEDMPDEPLVLNINVPNRLAKEMEGWRRTDVGEAPPRGLAKASMTPKPGAADTFHVEMEWGDAIQIPETEDGGAVMAGYASITWLGRIEGMTPHHPSMKSAEGAFDNFYA